MTVYAKANPTFTFKAGMVEGRVIDIKSIQDLANLPSKEELIAKLHVADQFAGAAPGRALNGVGRNLAVVVDQGVKENKFTARFA